MNQVLVVINDCNLLSDLRMLSETYLIMTELKSTVNGLSTIGSSEVIHACVDSEVYDLELLSSGPKTYSWLIKWFIIF